MDHELPPGISKPAQRALAGAGIRKLEDVARCSEAEFNALHGMGPKAIRILSEALREHDLNFAGKEHFAG